MHTLKALWPSYTETKICFCDSSHVVHPTCNSQVPLKGRLREGWVVTVSCGRARVKTPGSKNVPNPVPSKWCEEHNEFSFSLTSANLQEIVFSMFFLNLGSLGSPNQMSAPCWLLVSTWTQRGNGESLCLDAMQTLRFWTSSPSGDQATARTAWWKPRIAENFRNFSCLFL